MGAVLWWLRNNNCLPSLWFCQAARSQDHLFPSHSVHSGFFIMKGVLLLWRAGNNGRFHFSTVPWQQHLHSSCARSFSLTLSFFSPSLITSLSLNGAPPPQRFPSLSPACWLWRSHPLLHLPPFLSCGPHSNTQLCRVITHRVASLWYWPQHPKGAAAASSSSTLDAWQKNWVQLFSQFLLITNHCTEMQWYDLYYEQFFLHRC